MYRNTGYVITITNYLATTASHFTQINKGYPLDKDGGRRAGLHTARGGESALLRTPRSRALLRLAAEARNTRNDRKRHTRSRRPILAQRRVRRRCRFSLCSAPLMPAAAAAAGHTDQHRQRARSATRSHGVVVVVVVIVVVVVAVAVTRHCARSNARRRVVYTCARSHVLIRVDAGRLCVTLIYAHMFHVRSTYDRAH